MLSPVSMASVSRVHFGENALDRQGAYAKPVEEAAVAPAEEKKSSTGKKVAIGAGVVLAVLATLVGLTKGKVLKVLDEAALKEARWYSPKKWGHYLAKAGEGIAKYTWDPIAKLFSKKSATVAAGGAEAGADAAAGAATSVIA
jgi:hypothetical protein